MDRLVTALSQIAAGERIALVLFAVMALLAIAHPGDDRDRNALLLRARPLHALAWKLIAWAAILFSPFHAAWLLGTPSPAIAIRVGDALASGAACASIIILLAACGIERGLSPMRVRRGSLVNIAVLIAMVLAAWSMP